MQPKVREQWVHYEGGGAGIPSAVVGMRGLCLSLWGSRQMHLLSGLGYAARLSAGGLSSCRYDGTKQRTVDWLRHTEGKLLLLMHHVTSWHCTV